jgi:2-polyprenyl-3-methyl-5-hydroxy-6-metoxy-1,4-benzoquinol methylase
MMVPNEWDAFAAGWDANDDVHIYAQNAYDSWNRKVAPLISDIPGSRILDFGCGTGLLTEKFAAVCVQVVAVDTSAAMIDVLRGKIIDAGIDNVSALPLAINADTIRTSADLATRFHLIVASSVCSFLPDYEATLADLCSLLRPGGYFVQWDWLTDMPASRIQSAFDSANLVSHGIEEEFVMRSGSDSMPVVMGVGRLSENQKAIVVPQ